MSERQPDVAALVMDRIADSYRLARAILLGWEPTWTIVLSRATGPMKVIMDARPGP